MSRSFGNSSGRGSSSRGEQDRFHNQPSSSMAHHGRSRGKGRSQGGHPPGLKGKEIGLYYRDKAKEKNLKREKAVSIVKLAPLTEERIINALESSRGVFNKLYKDGNFSQYKTDLENKYTHINDSHFKRKFLEVISGNIQENLARAITSESKLTRDESKDQSVLKEFQESQQSQRYQNMLKFRSKLPVMDKRWELLELIKNNQVIVVSGETGCGKTTQVPQFILDDEIQAGNASVTRIACTQPRRISAITVSERVAAERAENLGRSVGYQIRLDKVLSREYGSILFCTTGTLLQLMKSDPALTGFSHVVLDEIHERSTESDFIISLLKQVIPKRPDLKVILMSATLNSESFSKYYDNCPMIHIPGFTYPVEEYYLEDVLNVTRFKFPQEPKLPPQRKHKKKIDEFTDLIGPYIRQLQAEGTYPQHVLDQLRNPKSEELSVELMEELIWYIASTKKPGAILVFLPGVSDIMKLNRLMIDSRRYPRSRFIVYPLHSFLPSVDQKAVFSEPPSGIRKIILSTSIAETSITIEDVVYVIDGGWTKYNKFDVQNNIKTLQAEWVSLANARQRRGRAGRVQPGYCYHLYTKARELVLEQYPAPEVLRSSLEQVILQIKIMQLGKVKTFLSSLMDSPNMKGVDLALDFLRTLDAIDADENLTPLGYHLAGLPLHPRAGKMIIWASLFSCADPVFAIAASLSFKEAFYMPLDKEEEARAKKLELSLGQYSDHIALAEAVRRFEIAYRRGTASGFCREYFLSFNTLKLLLEMKNQFGKFLYDMKFLTSENPGDRDANRNSDNTALVKAIVCAGLYPNIAAVRRVTKHGVQAWTPEDGRVCTHPSSVNDRAHSFPSPYLTYYTKQRSTAIYLHDSTCVSTPILLFAGSIGSIKREKGQYQISLTSSQTFTCDPRTADIIQRLREELDNLLRYKVTHPGTVCWDNHEGRILEAIIELVSQDDEKVGLYSGCQDGDFLD